MFHVFNVDITPPKKLPIFTTFLNFAKKNTKIFFFLTIWLSIFYKKFIKKNKKKIKKNLEVIHKS